MLFFWTMNPELIESIQEYLCGEFFPTLDSQDIYVCFKVSYVDNIVSFIVQSDLDVFQSVFFIDANSGLWEVQEQHTYDEVHGGEWIINIQNISETPSTFILQSNTEHVYVQRAIRVVNAMCVMCNGESVSHEYDVDF